MSKRIWLIDWMKADIDVEEVIDKIDDHLNIQYITLSDVNYKKRVYDVHCSKKRDFSNVIEYFLEEERMHDGDDIEILGMLLIKNDNEEFFTLNVALGYLDAARNDIADKHSKLDRHDYFVNNSVLYDFNSMKIKDFKDNLIS